MEYNNPIGTYGPMRKLFVIEEVRFIRGGAIIPRFGHASFKRGLEREFAKFVSSIDCPILLTVHGTGICEVAPMFVPLSDDVWLAGLSCAANQEGLDQVCPVLANAGTTRYSKSNSSGLPYRFIAFFRNLSAALRSRFFVTNASNTSPS